MDPQSKLLDANKRHVIFNVVITVMALIDFIRMVCTAAYRKVK
jgi:hypothetical protein